MNEITLELASILYEHANGAFADDGTPLDDALWLECAGEARKQGEWIR